MILGRRHPAPWRHKLQALVWPRAGWQRASRYLVKRFQRLPGSPHAIAAGLASGIAVSFTPLLGFHFALAFAIAWTVRGSMLAAAGATLVGNPWTFPALFAVSYRVGCYVLDLTPAAAALLADLSWKTSLDHMWRLFWPTMVGSVPVGAAAWLISYLVLVRVTALIQQRRRQRIARRGRATVQDG